MTRGEYGVWEVWLPAKDGQPAIHHNSKVKVITPLFAYTDHGVDAQFRYPWSYQPQANGSNAFLHGLLE